MSLGAGVVVVGWNAVQVWLVGFVSALQPLVFVLGVAMITLSVSTRSATRSTADPGSNATGRPS